MRRHGYQLKIMPQEGSPMTDKVSHNLPLSTHLCNGTQVYNPWLRHRSQEILTSPLEEAMTHSVAENGKEIQEGIQLFNFCFSFKKWFFYFI